MAYGHFPTRNVSGNSQDTGVLAEFILLPIHLTFRSEQEGRPIYEDREHVRIVIAGDNKNEVVREATAEDKRRFSEQYRAFKDGISDIHQSGTPLSQWPAMTPALVRMFNAQNVFTVEQLSQLSDTHLQSIGMGGREWLAKAQAYLDLATDSATATKLAAENEGLKREVEELKRQVRDLASAMQVSSKRKETEAVDAIVARKLQADAKA